MKQTIDKDWYSPTEANKFTPGAIDWICENYEVLSDGRWPVRSSNYTGNPFSQSEYTSGAYFEIPTCVIAEFHWRLTQCGRDGEVFRVLKCLKVDEKVLLAFLRVKEDVSFDTIILNVKSYISGRRKKMPYGEYIKS